MALAPRLAVGIASWRSTEGMIDAAQRWIEASLARTGPDHEVFVAIAEDGTLLGFASVAKQIEFTGEKRTCIGELTVSEAAEGHGVGRTLLAAVERLAEAQTLPLIVLDTGAANVRARRFYARNGFVEESVRLTRVLK